MTRLPLLGSLAVLGLVSLSTTSATLAGASPTVTLVKAALAPEATNDQRTVMTPDTGQTFLWVTTKIADAAQTVDLTKVSVVSGTSSFPLIGVDSAWDGDPKQFSMIAPVHLKKGGTSDPLEESRSVGPIGFAFTPGKTATLSVNTPPQSFCLLFAVPKAFKTGKVVGLGAAELPLPALSAAGN